MTASRDTTQQMSALRRAVASAIGEVTGVPARVITSRSVAGGSINRAELVALDDGRSFFVKSNPAPLPRMFACEAEGLDALAAVGVLRVPRPLHVGGSDASSIPFLLLEAIASGPAPPDLAERFGQRLAELHRRSSAERYGFSSDNYIGATSQPNAWCADWCEFWRRHRLGHQLALARAASRSDRELDRLGDALLDRLEQWLEEPAEPPCLLHGDLWGGNYLVDAAGEPVLIDPAVYYGRREAELAMTRLFGGFEPRFYDAYEESWPLAPGARERLAIYELYHLLNHLNLFGSGYRAACISRLRSLVGR